jgi:hypothetical protein
METEIVLISSTGAIEGGRVLYTIGKIEVASSWHPEGGAPLQDNWQETILRDLIRKAEDISTPTLSSGSIIKMTRRSGAKRPG